LSYWDEWNKKRGISPPAMLKSGNKKLPMKNEISNDRLFSFVVLLILGIIIYIGCPVWNIVDNIQEGDFFYRSASANYVLIHFTPTGSGSDVSFPALLISEPREIRKIARLVNRGVSISPCFDNIYIEFWEDSFKRPTYQTVDEDCSYYNRKLKSYFDDLKNHPTHYIYNIKIPVQIPPEKVVEDFEKENLTPFLLYGSTPNLPRIHINTEWFPENEEEWSLEKEEEGLAYFQSIIDELAEIYPIVSIEETRCNYMIAGGEEGCKLNAYIVFELGTDLSEIEENANQLGLDVYSIKDNEYYFLPLVIEESDLPNVQKMVITKFDYVTDVYRFPATEP
jgi:hypothetical protein